MTKVELITRVACGQNIPAQVVGTVLNTCLDTITEALFRGERVLITGFGTFNVYTNKERICYNPRTGEKKPQPEIKYVHFTQSSKFRRHFREK